jgi:4a-hydroxytetrahydrobiopterin dehydratase
LESETAMTDLLHQRCQPQSGAAMDEATIRTHLAQVSGWTLHDGAIEKTFPFKDFHETIAFVNALAWICHVEDHHPELRVSYDRCVVRFSTHSVRGVSVNDFVCAAKADALVSFAG